MTLEYDLSIVGPALLAGLLVLSTHVPLGRKVLERGIIFIDLAIAQVAGLGVVVADALGKEAHGWEVQLAAISASMLAAFGLYGCEQRWPDILEALIGVFFILAATASILLLSNNPHGGEHLQNLLVGQILWVDYRQLLPVTAIYSLILGIWFGYGDRLPRMAFYLIFAIAITLSVQLVGVYLVFTSLIVPALASRQLSVKWQIPVACLVGGFAYLSGIGLSMIYDYPTGAMIVWMMAVIAAIAAGIISAMRVRDRSS